MTTQDEEDRRSAREELEDAISDLLGPVSCVRSLEEMIAAEPSLKDSRHAAIVALCRILARQMDVGGVEVSSRSTAAYLSALKDLRKAADEQPAKKAPGTTGGDEDDGAGEDEAPKSGLAGLRGTVTHIKAGRTA